MTRALIIEDSRTQAKKLSELLSANGYEVELAYDGLAGVSASLANPPDVVITDVVMPGCDGFEVCRRLRANERTASVPIMVLTSLTEPHDVVRALSAGANNYATKPLRADDMLARLQRLVHPATESRKRIAVDASKDAIIEMLYSALEDASARNAELESSRAALERANSSRDEMLGIVAHELRTPLTSMSLRAQLSKRKISEKWPTEAVELVDNVARSTTRMVRIIEDLLQASQLDAGTFTIQRDAVDLSLLAADVVGRARSAHPDFTITLHAPPTLTVQCDNTRIDQVLSNLIGNAIKYSGAAREVDVRVEADEAFASLSVKDSGIGIPPDKLPHIFDRFYRTDEGQRAAKGVGLGLYISRRLAELHGGAITAESAPNTGSTFTLTLPRSPA